MLPPKGQKGDKIPVTYVRAYDPEDNELEWILVTSLKVDSAEEDKIRSKELPVGSEKVESTHRSLMQKRLKKPGTWWLKCNANKMADLRTLRGNGKWHLLWQIESNEDTIKLAA